MRKYLKPLIVTSFVAVGLLLASCDRNLSKPTAEQQNAEQNQISQDYNLEFTPNHVGVPEGVQLAPEQILRYNSDELETIDPSISHYDSSFSIINITFDTLVRKARDNEYIPVAATSWETSADGLTWTFHLRPEAKWQDGQPVTAKDFVYSWQRLVDPKTGAPYADYLALMNVKNAQEVVNGKVAVQDLGVRAVDDYTFEVQLTQETPWLIQMVSLGVLAPLRQDIIEKFGSDWTKPGNYIGNGPFKLTEYRINDIMKYEKVADYWGAKDIALTSIEFDFRQDSNAAYYGYLEGRYPISGLGKEELKRARTDRPEEIYVSAQPTIYYFTFNPATITDVRVRKAFSLLLDRETILYKVLEQHQPAYKFIPDGILDSDKVQEYEWKDTPREERVKEAVKLLTEAGYSKDNPVTLKYPTTDIKNNKVFIALREILNTDSQGAVVLDPIVREGKAYYELLNKLDYDLLGSGWHPDYDHISTFTSIFTCNNANNRLKYCNPHYDELLAQAAVEKDKEKRQELYGEAVKVLQDDYVMIPYMNPNSYFLKSPALGGYNKDNYNRNYRDYYFVANKRVKKVD